MSKVKTLKDRAWVLAGLGIGDKLSKGCGLCYELSHKRDGLGYKSISRLFGVVWLGRYGTYTEERRDILAFILGTPDDVIEQLI